MNKSYELKRGAIANFPILPSVMAYGSVFGVLAAQKGINLLELFIMNFTIYAGSAKFVMVDMWSENIEIFSMLLAVFAINLRYVLICASLNPLFKQATIMQKTIMIHFVVDENWAVTINEQRKGTATIWFLFGGGICILIVWTLATILGHQLGSIIGNPKSLGLDFAFLAVFTAFTVNLYRGKEDILPWFFAVLVALLIEHFLGGNWHIFFGGIAGAIFALFINKGNK